MTDGISERACGLDLALGDPHWLPHPVRGIGWLISQSEQLMAAEAACHCGLPEYFFAGRSLLSRRPSYGLRSVGEYLLGLLLPGATKSRHRIGLSDTSLSAGDIEKARAEVWR